MRVCTEDTVLSVTANLKMNSELLSRPSDMDNYTAAGITNIPQLHALRTIQALGDDRSTSDDQPVLVDQNLRDS